MSPTHVFVFIFLFFSCSFASDIYVKITGSDSTTCGSQDNPCGTVYGAISVSIPGDTILFYPGNFVLDTSKTAIISHNLTFTTAVPQEGPVDFTFNGNCLNSGVKSAFEITNSESNKIMRVEFQSITFTGLVCSGSNNSSFPPIIFVESGTQQGKSFGVQVLLNHVNFGDNFFSYTDSSVVNPFYSALISSYSPNGSDRVSIKITSSVFSINHAIAIASNGEALLELDRVGMYNTSFYAFPSLYLTNIHNLTLITCDFTTNLEYNNPLASFIFVNGSQKGTHVHLLDVAFTNAYAPALKFEGPVLLRANVTFFGGLTNEGSSTSTIPYISDASAISFYQPVVKTVVGIIEILNSRFVSNGLSNQNLPTASVISAGGFATMHIEACLFDTNYGVNIAVLNPAKDAHVEIVHSTFGSTNSSALLLATTGPSNYRTSIESCTFSNTGVSKNLNGTINFGGFTTSSLPGLNTVQMQHSEISNTAVGIYAGPFEQAHFVSVTMKDVSTGIKCDGAIVTVDGTSAIGQVSCSNGCSVTINNKAQC